MSRNPGHFCGLPGGRHAYMSLHVGLRDALCASFVHLFVCSRAAAATDWKPLLVRTSTNSYRCRREKQIPLYSARFGRTTRNGCSLLSLLDVVQERVHQSVKRAFVSVHGVRAHVM